MADTAIQMQTGQTVNAKSRYRLFAILAGLYLAQGIPSYLFVAAIPAILRENGVSRTSIGLLSFLMLPLVIKFLWAPVVDRFRPIARAHRGGWVLITQGGSILCLLSLALIAPTNIMGIFIIGFVASILLSTQDIATDGYAAKYLAPEDRAVGNAIQGGSVAFGVLLGGTLGLVLYHHFGWQPMVLTISAISVLPLIAAFYMREDDPEGKKAEIDRPSLFAFFRRREARQILWIALIYRASEGLVKAMEGAYLVDAKVSLDMIGYLSGGSATIAGLGGSVLAAFLMRKYSAGWVLTLLGALRTLCFAIFASHAIGWVHGYEALFGASIFQTIIRYMEIVALYSLFMSVSSSKQPGTDFTILACAQLIVYLIGSSLSGKLADMLGYGALFGISTAISGVAVIATTVMLQASRQRRNAQQGAQ